MHQRKKILQEEWNKIQGHLEDKHGVKPSQSNDPYIKKILEIVENDS